MFYNILDVKKMVDLGDSKFVRKTLLEKDNSGVCVVGIKKNEIIDTHTAEENAAVYVVDGEIELHFDAEKFTLKKGEMLLFKKDIQHKVLANKDSVFLLMKV